ncbi:Serine/threonine-protein kinase PrkC [Polystyrenella longa]|uniref:non-specific serine/threonine protein kinase n=1 Tax=Polystyrenella longa TaxID=2528007 RepID=A0A518CS97_9PLAN|nr:serine/threonine-protein kinase [Polystyrenella longa]QDU82074.1 Serine/threonine-protein kinase PrkC [Polystyrenella longa]
MSHSKNTPDANDSQNELPDSFSPEEKKLFELLNQYVEGQHQQDTDSCATLMHTHPRMKELYRCLDNLDSLAPQSPVDSTFVPENEPVIDSLTSSMLQELWIENYELLEEIGRGGMGVVYKAMQTDLQRIVAIKMIRSSSLASSEEVKRFEQEARAAGKLQHPHIVKIFEAGHIGGQPYFSMEYIPGQSLFQVLNRGPLDPRRSVELLEKISRAVEHLHQHQLLHRDLKPQNILIDQSDSPYVTDFGLAKLLEDDLDLTQTGSVLGTPGYMSPEQASPSTGTCCAASDVYSLGAILYHCLTGRAPFSGPNPFETLMAVLESEPLLPRKLNPRIPRELEAICLKCLEKKPENRFQSAEELANELQRFLQGEPLQTGAAEWGHRFKRFVRRELPLVVRLSAIGIAAAIVQLNYVLFGAEEELHTNVMTIFSLWALAVCGFQWLVNRNRMPNFTRYGWSAADVLFLTWMFSVVEGPLGPLPAAYALLIVASGLFFQLSLVGITTGLSVICYGFVLWFNMEIEQNLFFGVIYEALLLIFGILTGHHVRRMNLLNQYFQRSSEPPLTQD